MKNKRFIAAAICPLCRQADKIFIYEENNEQWRACAHCSFQESAASIAEAQDELPTRVNQNRIGEKPLAHETVVEAVKIIDPNR